MNKALVISIKPEYAAKIYAGEKIFELRKVPPRNLNAVYLVYESAPVSKITGFITFGYALTAPSHLIDALLRDMLEVTQKRVEEMMGISPDELIDYAGGGDKFVTALMIRQAVKDKTFERYDIRPPQNWELTPLETIRLEPPPARETAAGRPRRPAGFQRP